MKRKTSSLRSEAWVGSSDEASALSFSTEDRRSLFTQLEPILFPKGGALFRFLTQSSTNTVVNTHLARWKMTGPESVLWAVVVNYKTNFGLSAKEIFAECLNPKRSTITVSTQQALHTAISQNLPILVEAMHLKVSDLAKALPEVLHKWTDPAKETVCYLRDHFEALIEASPDPIDQIGILQFLAKSAVLYPELVFSIMQKVVSRLFSFEPGNPIPLFQECLSKDLVVDLLIRAPQNPTGICSRALCFYLSQFEDMDYSDFVERALQHDLPLHHILTLSLNTALEIPVRMALLKREEFPNLYLGRALGGVNALSLESIIEEREAFTCQLHVWLNTMQKTLQTQENPEDKRRLVYNFFALFSQLTVRVRVVDASKLEMEEVSWLDGDKTTSTDTTTCRPFTVLPPAERSQTFHSYTVGIVLPVSQDPVFAGKKNLFTADISGPFQRPLSLVELPPAIKATYQRRGSGKVTIYDRLDPMVLKLLERNCRQLGLLPNKTTKQLLLDIFPGQDVLRSAKVLQSQPEESLAKVAQYCKEQALDLDPVFLMELLIQSINSKLKTLTSDETAAYSAKMPQAKRHTPWTSNHNEALFQKEGYESPIPMYVVKGVVTQRDLKFLLTLFKTHRKLIFYTESTGSMIRITRQEFLEFDQQFGLNTPRDVKGLVKLFKAYPSKIPSYLAILNLLDPAVIKQCWRILPKAYPFLQDMIKALPAIQLVHKQESSSDSETMEAVDQVCELSSLYFGYDPLLLKQRILTIELNSVEKSFLFAQSLHAYAWLLSPVSATQVKDLCDKLDSFLVVQTLATKQQFLIYVAANKNCWIQQKATHLQVIQHLIRVFAFGNHNDQQLRNSHPAGHWSLHFTGVAIHLENLRLSDWFKQLETQKPIFMDLLARLKTLLGLVHNALHTPELRTAYHKLLATEVTETGVCMEARLAFIDPLQTALTPLPDEKKGWLGLPPISVPDAVLEDDQKEAILVQCEMAKDFIVLRCTLIFRLNQERRAQNLAEISITDDLWNEDRIYSALKTQWPEKGDETAEMFESDPQITDFYNGLMGKIIDVETKSTKVAEAADQAEPETEAHAKIDSESDSEELDAGPADPPLSAKSPHQKGVRPPAPLGGTHTKSSLLRAAALRGNPLRKGH